MPPKYTYRDQSRQNVNAYGSQIINTSMNALNISSSNPVPGTPSAEEMSDKLQQLETEYWTFYVTKMRRPEWTEKVPGFIGVLLDQRHASALQVSGALQRFSEDLKNGRSLSISFHIDNLHRLFAGNEGVRLHQGALRDAEQAAKLIIDRKFQIWMDQYKEANARQESVPRS